MKAAKIIIKRLFISIALFTLAFSSSCFAAGCVNWSQGTFIPEQNAAGQKLPAYGLYWFNTQLGSNLTQTQSAAAACTADDPAAKASCMANLKQQGYFDPSRPTIIFIHGWQPNTVVNQHRYDFCYQYSVGQNQKSDVYNTLQPWSGWNVGVFYWNQFADESDVTAAESKIYSTQGKNGMRWAYDTITTAGQISTAYCESSDPTCVMPKDDIADMAYKAIEQALPASSQYNGSELRIAGHSLGAQIAIQVTDRMLSNKAMPQPTSLALMDPFFSNLTIDNMTTSVVDYNNAKVDDILKAVPNFPIAVYRTSHISFAPFGNPDAALMSKVAYMRIYPAEYIKGVGPLGQLGADHTSASYLYFISKAYQPDSNPALQEENEVTHSDYIDASSTNAEIRALMGQQRFEGPLPSSTANLGLTPTYAQTWTTQFTNQEPLNPNNR